jgi:hypothetical protein
MQAIINANKAMNTTDVNNIIKQSNNTKIPLLDRIALLTSNLNLLKDKFSKAENILS